jgi:adenylyl-sulfate kinase
MPAQRMLQMVVTEPATAQTIGTGMAMPVAGRDEGMSLTPAGAQGLTVWLTGLSGAGKTTIGRQLEHRLRQSCAVELLDADIVRTYLCKDLGYSREDRNENVRRLGFVANLLSQRGVIVLVTAISPYRAARDKVRATVGRFVEVYVNAPIAACEQRDVKGLYKRARAGEIPFFTGIDDPYEPPLTPEVECHTDHESVDDSVSKVITAIEQKLNRRL